MVLAADGAARLPRTPLAGPRGRPCPTADVHRSAQHFLDRADQDHRCRCRCRCLVESGLGEALGQKPGLSGWYLEEASLLADVERIDWWPVAVQEACRVQGERVMSVTTAWAWDNHYLSGIVTEPYGSRMDKISALRELPPEKLPLGRLDAPYLLVDAEAWASAVRTARAGGAEWSGQDS